MNDADSVGYKEFPDVVLRNILSYVPKDNFLNVRLVNRQWNKVSKEKSLWRKVDLVFPRKPEQIAFLASNVLGAELEELKITGFHGFHDSAFQNESERQTISVAVLDKIKASCPGLKTLVFRKCRFDLEPTAQDNLPDTLETLEFYRCRLPDLSDSWTTEMTPRELLPNLSTLKVEISSVDMQFLRYVRARSPVKNLSLRQSFLGHIPLHEFLPPPPPQRDPEQVLRVLDISGTGEYGEKVLEDWVLNDEKCEVTHLFMEDCYVLPRPVPAHLRIEFLSVAGYNAGSFGQYAAERTFLDINEWASIPTMRVINASGSHLTRVQRNELVATHPTVAFDVSEDFRESPRIFV